LIVKLIDNSCAPYYVCSTNLRRVNIALLILCQLLWVRTTTALQGSHIQVTVLYLFTVEADSHRPVP